MHDEDAIYREEVEAAKAAGEAKQGLDMFAFMVSFKGVFLEGMEVVFIVLTFGLNADNIPAASLGAIAAVVIVLGIAVALRRPLSMINENLLKYGVGLLLASFGTYWAVEGIGIFRDGRESLELARSRPDDPGPAGGLVAAQPDLRRRAAQAGRRGAGRRRRSLWR